MPQQENTPALDQQLLSDLYKQYHLGWEKLLAKLGLPINIGIVKTMTLGEAKAFAARFTNQAAARSTNPARSELPPGSPSASERLNEPTQTKGIPSTHPAFSGAVEEIATQILSVLQAAGKPLKAKEILANLRMRGQATTLQRSDINAVLYGEIFRLKLAQVDSSFCWRLVDQVRLRPAEAGRVWPATSAESEIIRIGSILAAHGHRITAMKAITPARRLPPMTPIPKTPHSELESAAYEIDDIFAKDQSSRSRLNAIVDAVKPNEIAPQADFTADADDDQRKFILSQAKTIRLLAPAGSGKTQSIINKILRNVSMGHSLARTLVLAFDNAACLSLREKLELGLTQNGAKLRSQANILTLNKFGYQLIRKELANKYGPCSLGANPEKDRHESMRLALDELKSKAPSAYNLLPSRLARRVYLDLISTLKNEVIIPDKMLAGDPASVERFLDLAERTGFLVPWLEPHRNSLEWDTLKTKIPSLLIHIYRLYNDINRRHNRIDFDDQKLLAYLGLEADADLAAAATAQFTSVIVDEFQDINRLDFEFIRLVAHNKQLIVVGDDDQSIYAFRGCSPDYIIDFPERIGSETETHILKTNYRCPQNVVEMGNSLIAHNTHRINKMQVAHRTDLADVKLWHCLNSASEAQVLARFIKKLYTDRAAKGFRYADVAVLLRINSQSLPLQIALILEEVPYHCRQEENVIVSDTMKKLLGLVGLHIGLRSRPSDFSRSDTKLICECVKQYTKERDIQHLHREIERHGGYLQYARNSDGSALPSGLSQADFRRAMEELVKDATPLELVQRITTNFKYLGGIIGTLEDAINDNLPLGEIVDIAGRFKGDVSQFHSLLTDLLQKVEGGLYHCEEGDAVNLLTYFRAKGRQWNTVIIPGANQKVIPLARSKVEDERRLFYVAVTRATSNLVISYVRHAVRSKVEPSQFIAEMGLASAEEKRAKALS